MSILSAEEVETISEIDLAIFVAKYTLGYDAVSDDGMNAWNGQTPILHLTDWGGGIRSLTLHVTSNHWPVPWRPYDDLSQAILMIAPMKEKFGLKTALADLSDQSVLFSITDGNVVRSASGSLSRSILVACGKIIVSVLKSRDVSATVLE